MLNLLGPSFLWSVRLRAFGTYDRALSLRHDVHGPLDFAMLEYEAQNIIPASQDIEDPFVSPALTEEQGREWIRRTGEFGFLEPALHNDAAIGDPPVYAIGKGLYEHVKNSEEHFGVPVYSSGRHGCLYMHPESLDAMDYLYSRNRDFLGMCSFGFYMMIEYGVRNTGVVREGSKLTYLSDVRETIAGHGFWFPYHPVVTTIDEWRPLRGWDRTHELDCSYELTDTLLRREIFAGAKAANPELENTVYSMQFHPDYSADVSKNSGRGTLDYLRYLIAVAMRTNTWIVNRKDLYQRLTDLQDVLFRVGDDGTVTVHNPTNRRIVGLTVEQTQPFASAWVEDIELLHLVDNRIVTVPPLAPDETIRIRFEATPGSNLRLPSPNHEGLTILSAIRNPNTEEVTVIVDVCREQRVRVDGIAFQSKYEIVIEGGPRSIQTPRRSFNHLIWLGYMKAEEFLEIHVPGEEAAFSEQVIRIKELPNDIISEVA
ncbi:MAG: hypothetical protein MI741_00700 [Rhodospirillales bacterium]|nr:hypothetical protein [Rhodospirillales bacterium]